MTKRHTGAQPCRSSAYRSTGASSLAIRVRNALDEMQSAVECSPTGHIERQHATRSRISDRTPFRRAGLRKAMVRGSSFLSSPTLSTMTFFPTLQRLSVYEHAGHVTYCVGRRAKVRGRGMPSKVCAVGVVVSTALTSDGTSERRPTLAIPSSV